MLREMVSRFHFTTAMAAAGRSTYSLFLALSVLSSAHSSVAADTEPPARQAKLWFLEGKWKEARVLQEKVVADERTRLRKDHPDLIAPLDFLAQLQEFLEDFDAARRTRKELIELTRAYSGKEIWRVDDARRDLDRIERMVRLPSEQRKHLRDAHLLLLQAVNEQ